ncbi:MAG: excinuclease ABC subunit UvrC [Trueperaceae bacterium]|nr:excinuclease ABC subunit UvrC [Trueperaceae bacterium]
MPLTRDDLPVLPRKPGCYLFQAEDGPVYIGKAKDLRARVASHFGAPSGSKSRFVTRLADRFEFIVTDTETEALVLEADLIKRHKPRFNVQLKDDKSYPFLKLTDEPYPRLLFTRAHRDDGGTYFGPYPSAGTVKQVLDLVNKTFQLRVNSGTPMRPRTKPCLRFHMGHCLAPCVGNVTPEAYARRVEQARAFLQGRVAEVLGQLEAEMREAADRFEFERAAKVRDRMEAVRRVTGYDSEVARQPGLDLDFLGFAVAGSYAMVQMFQMRRGRVTGRDTRFLRNAKDAGEDEILERFMADYYRQATYVPPLVLVPSDALDRDTWEAFLSERAGRRVELRRPRRGDKVDLVDMANRNARTGVDAELARLERRGDAPGVGELQELLGLDEPPWRIEGYDVSNLMGSHTVASIVVFEGGRPRKSAYRKMRIRDLDKPDDFLAMHQVLTRRFTGRLAESMTVPDLVLIDGGKGQVSAARRALEEVGVRVPVVGLAKREETLVTSEGRELLVPLTHPALRLLAFARDEAHRVAVGYNRNRRGRAGTRSVLDEVPGIGPKRRDALLAHFSSVDQLRAAGEPELAAVPGVGPAAAAAVRAYFARQDATAAGEPGEPPDRPHGEASDEPADDASVPS